jgi:hypothetical protein
MTTLISNTSHAHYSILIFAPEPNETEYRAEIHFKGDPEGSRSLQVSHESESHVRVTAAHLADANTTRADVNFETNRLFWEKLRKPNPSARIPGTDYSGAVAHTSLKGATPPDNGWKADGPVDPATIHPPEVIPPRNQVTDWARQRNDYGTDQMQRWSEESKSVREGRRKNPLN